MAGVRRGKRNVSLYHCYHLLWCVFCSRSRIANIVSGSISAMGNGNNNQLAFSPSHVTDAGPVVRSVHPEEQ